MSSDQSDHLSRLIAEIGNEPGAAVTEEDRFIAAVWAALERLLAREDYPAPSRSYLLQFACSIHHAFSYDPKVDPLRFGAVADAAQALQRAVDALGWAEFQMLREVTRGLPWEELEALYEARMASRRADRRDPEKGSGGADRADTRLERGAADISGTAALRGRPRREIASAVADCTLVAFEAITGQPATMRVREVERPYGKTSERGTQWHRQRRAHPAHRLREPLRRGQRRAGRAPLQRVVRPGLRGDRVAGRHPGRPVDRHQPAPQAAGRDGREVAGRPV